MIKTLKESLVYSDSWLSFYQDKVSFPSGAVGTYVKLRRKHGVGLVLLNSVNKLVLVKLHRYATQLESWEIPGGGIEPGQQVEEAAISEAQEEVGIHLNAKLLQPLGIYYPLNSLSDERISLFLAHISESELSDHIPNDAEIISATLIDISQALQMIKDGLINDAITALAIHLTIHRLSLGS